MLNWRCLQIPRGRWMSTICMYLGCLICPLPLPSLGGWGMLCGPLSARSGGLPRTYHSTGV